MRMDGKHTSMWGVWIILSVAVLVALGVGLYFIIKHFTKKHCDCPNGCDDSGKCKPAPSNSIWNASTKTIAKNKLKTLLQSSNDLQNSNDLRDLQNSNDQIPEYVLTCALEKFMSIYKTPQDFMNSLNRDKTSLIKIMQNCMKKGGNPDPNVCDPACKHGEKCTNKKCVRIDPNVCDPACKHGEKCTNKKCVPSDPSKVCNPPCKYGESCIKNGCLPSKWTSEFYNTFRNDMIADVKQTMHINKHIATCITDGFKRKYSNPQKMANETKDNIDDLFGDLYTECGQQPPPPPPSNSCDITISDSCMSKGQNARNRGDSCEYVIDSCMSNVLPPTTDPTYEDCLRQLENISSYACDNMKRQKPGPGPPRKPEVWFCAKNADGTCGQCTISTPENPAPPHVPIGPDCQSLESCSDDMYCTPLPEFSLGIY